MSIHNTTGIENTPYHFPVIRKIKSSQIIDWLHYGTTDLLKARFASLFYGVVFASAGLLMHEVLFEVSWLLSGLTSGFLLIGPFLAMGLYDLSRRIEAGEQPTLIPTLTSWRPNILNVGIFAGVLVVILLIWARASLVIFALFFQGGLPTFLEMIQTLITFEQPTFALVYFAVGGFFAAFVYAVSVVAIPLMADRKTDAVTAAIASLLSVTRNLIPMTLWALTIVLLVIIGFATHYIGLIITMPIIGHASWHAYRDLVESV
jgi:uncharacterized membrane protein